MAACCVFVGPYVIGFFFFFTVRLSRLVASPSVVSKLGSRLNG